MQILSTVDLNVQRNQGTAHYLFAATFKWYFIEVSPL